MKKKSIYMQYLLDYLIFTREIRVPIWLTLIWSPRNIIQSVSQKRKWIAHINPENVYSTWSKQGRFHIFYFLFSYVRQN